MKVVIPETLNEITLDQFLKFQKVIKAEDITEDILCLAMVTIFCKLTVEQARNIEVKDYNEIVLQLSEVLKQEPKFIQRFSLEGLEFGFIPNLDNITAGEYIDLDTYLKDEETHINAMAILYRPIVSSIKNDYKIDTYESSEKYKDVMQFMPLDVYLGSMVFFLQFKQRIIDSYETLFSTVETGEGIRSGFGDKWGWYQSIYTVTGGSVFDFEKATSMELHGFLTFLEFKIDLANEENKHIGNERL